MDAANNRSVPPEGSPTWLGAGRFLVGLVGDKWEDRLRIPSDFVRRYSTELEAAPPSTVLQTPSGSWVVMKIVAAGGKRVEFCDGWMEFVRANNLIYGDVLVLFATNPNHFHVSFFDESLCGKNLPPTLFVPPTQPAEPIWYEQLICLKGYNRYALQLKTWFLEKTGLSKFPAVDIFDVRGAMWSVQIQRGAFGSGWCKFWEGNQFAAGDDCVVRCLSDIRGNVIRVECKKVQIA